MHLSEVNVSDAKIERKKGGERKSMKLQRLLKVKRRITKFTRLVAKGLRRSFYPGTESPFVPSDVSTVYMDGAMRLERL